MKTPFGKQAGGLRLERMQGSPRYRDGEFRNVHPLLPGLKGGAVMPSIGEFICSSGRRVPEAGSGVPLLMPLLGEAVEPSRAGAPTPWWRTPGKTVDAAPATEAPADQLEPNAPLAWPLD